MGNVFSSTSSSDFTFARTSYSSSDTVELDPSGAQEGADSHLSPELILLDRMPVGLAIYDSDGVLVHANARFSSLVGCEHLPSGDDGKIRRWRGYARDGGGALALDDYPCRRAMRGETVSPGIDLSFSGEDGTARWLNVSAAPVCDPDRNAVIGVVLLFLDVPDPALAATFANRAARRFTQFAEHSSAAIWIADAATREFTYRNPGHLDLIGSGGVAIACLSDWIDIVEETDRERLRQQYERVLGGGTGRCEYRLRAAAGRGLCQVREISFPIRGDAGELLMIGGITEDITPACEDQILYFVGQPAASSPLLANVLQRGGLMVKPFASIAELLDVARFLTPGCALVDVASSADGDADLPRLLAAHAKTLPVIIVGRPDARASTAVAAMRAGATDYLVPPFADGEMTEALLRALARLPKSAADPKGGNEGLARLANLSRRESEVLAGLRGGGTNKSIGRDLGISPRTVELHRAHLMERMNVRSLAELLQVAHAAVSPA